MQSFHRLHALIELADGDFQLADGDFDGSESVVEVTNVSPDLDLRTKQNPAHDDDGSDDLLGVSSRHRSPHP